MRRDLGNHAERDSLVRRRVVEQAIWVGDPCEGWSKLLMSLRDSVPRSLPLRCGAALSLPLGRCPLRRRRTRIVTQPGEPRDQRIAQDIAVGSVMEPPVAVRAAGDGVVGSVRSTLA